MSSLNIFLVVQRCIIMTLKAKELTPKQILTVPCATCGAAVGEVCELHTGAPRVEPNRAETSRSRTPWERTPPTINSECQFHPATYRSSSTPNSSSSPRAFTYCAFPIVPVPFGPIS
jgi:hypothetical protein